MLQTESDQHTEQQQGKDGQEDGADVSEAVSHVMATMHGIQPSNGMPAKLVPTPTGDVFLDGTNIEALLDTCLSLILFVVLFNGRLWCLESH